MKPRSPDAKFKVGDKVWSVSNHKIYGVVVKATGHRVKVDGVTIDGWYHESYWLSAEEILPHVMMEE